MRTKTKVIVTIALFTLLGFMLNPNAPLGALLWDAPPASDAPAPTGAQVGLLMLVALIESIAFGLGAALLLHGAPLARRLAQAGVPARAAWLAIAWGLVSWVPHTAMHMTSASMAQLIVIEYTFHVTLVAAAAVLARFFLDLARARAAPRAEAAPAVRPVGAG